MKYNKLDKMMNAFVHNRCFQVRGGMRLSEQDVSTLADQLLNAMTAYITDAALLLFYTQLQLMLRNAQLHQLQGVIPNPRDAMQQKSNALQAVYTNITDRVKSAEVPMTSLLASKSKTAEKAHLDTMYMTYFSILEAHWNCTQTIVNGYLVAIASAVQDYKTMQNELEAMFGPHTTTLGGVCTKWNQLWRVRMGASAPLAATPAETVNAFVHALDKKQNDAQQLREDAEELGRVAQYCENTGTVLNHARARIDQSGLKTLKRAIRAKQEQFGADAARCMEQLQQKRARKMAASNSVALTDIALQIQGLLAFESKTKQLITSVAADIERKSRN